MGIGFDLQKASYPVRSDDPSDQEQCFGKDLAQPYSMISRTDLLLIFVEAALRIVLMARAVLPCLPITFPRSSLATFSSMTEVCSPSISVTTTSSGLSTNALAMYVISSFISISPPSRVEQVRSM